MDNQVLNLLGDCVCIINKEGKILFANEALLNLCGLKGEDIIGRNCFEVFHHCPRECEECYFVNIICPRKAVSDGKTVSVIHRHFMPDGTERIFDIMASPFKDDNGNIVGSIEVLRDITEKEMLKHELEKSEKRLRLIASSIGEGIYVLDGLGNLIFMNLEAERLLGWKETELLNKRVHDIIHSKKSDGSHLSEDECPILNVLKTGERYYSSYFSEEVFLRKDGTSFPVAFIATPILDEGRIIGVVAAFRDISVRKKMRDDILNLKKLESLADLAGGIAHDFNNLLTAIMGHISISKMYLRPEDKIYNNLTIAESACLNARNLTYQLLLFAKGEKPSRKVTEIAKLLRETASFFENDPRYKVEFNIPDDLWLVEVDEVQIKQVMHNLFLNAIEAMPSGGGIIIKAENYMVSERDNLPIRNGKFVKVYIKDSGIGIKQKDLTRIFDPYYTTKQMDFHKGVGLGLSLCYSVIKRHEGHIWAESEEGKGTTIYLLIPALEIQREPAAYRGRVLLMEDDEMVGHLALEMLSHLGYHADFVRDGADAIRLYEDSLKAGRRYNFVILDLTVNKGMGGKETMERLLKIDPEIRAIISSGYVDDPVMLNYEDFGFMSAIAKPYDIDQLKDILLKIEEG